MQRQKTIAKWIAVLLALTLSVSGYIIFSTIYKANKNNTKTSANGSTAPTDEEKHQPYYSVFPRFPEKFGKTSVNHVGGENDEKLIKVIANGEITYCFFESASVEFDVDSVGIYLAIFDKNTLKSVKKICDNKETIAAVVMRDEYIILLAQSATYAKFYALTASGALACVSANHDLFEKPQLYSFENELYLFYSSANILRIATIAADLSIHENSFTFETKNVVVKAIVPIVGGFNLIISSGDSELKIVQFLHKSGFTLLFSHDKVEFMQLRCIINSATSSEFNDTSDKEPHYIILAKESAGMRLFSFDTKFSLVGENAIKGVDSAVILQAKDGLCVVTNTNTFYFCIHLEQISALSSKTGISGKLSAILYDNRNYILTENGGTISVLSMSDKEIFTTIYTAENVGGTPYAVMSFDRLILAFSSQNNTGNLHMNFGKSDIFLTETML